MITDLLELENITLEMILHCSFHNNLIFLPEGHILKSQMVPVLQQNSVFSPHPHRLAPDTSFSSRENIYAHLFSTIPNISLGPHTMRQWKYIIAHKLKIRDLGHRNIQWLTESHTALRSSRADLNQAFWGISSVSPATIEDISDFIFSLSFSTKLKS